MPSFRPRLRPAPALLLALFLILPLAAGLGLAGPALALDITGGDGGDGGGSLTVGDGGQNGSISNAPADSQIITSTGGAGGGVGLGGNGSNNTEGGPGSNGGAGGNALPNLGGAAGGPNPNGGVGGGGGGNSGGGGGGGGAAVLNAAQTISVDNVMIEGGKGGNGTLGGGGGGGGGHAAAYLHNLQGNLVRVTSGANGAANGLADGGRGGAAVLNITGTLIADRVLIEKTTDGNGDGGNVQVDIAALDAGSVDSTIELINTSATLGAGDRVKLGDLTFGAGRSVTITDSGDKRNGMLTAGGRLTVLGAGAKFTSPGGAFGVNYDAKGQDLLFVVRPDDVTNANILLEATDGIILVDSSNRIYLGSDVGAGPYSGMTVGGKVTLIKGTDNTVTFDQNGVPLRHGASNYYFDLKNDSLGLVATYQGRDLDETAGKIYNLSNISRLTLLQNGKELVIDVIGRELDQSTSDDGSTKVVSAGSGGQINHHVLCSTRLNAFNLLLGLERQPDFAVGRGFVSAFGEFGWGDYQARDSRRGLNVRANGLVRNYGLGLMAAWQHPEGFGLEGSLRAGRLESDLGSSHNAGPGVEFGSMGTWYVGGHLGLSYDWRLSDEQALRLYGKFLWDHQGDDRVVSRAAEDLTFDSVDSSRLRLGARLTREFDDGWSVFGDAAWEYEADGRVRSQVDGLNTLGLRTNGHNAVLKVGAGRQILGEGEEGGGWEIQGLLTGYVGDKHGLSGSLMLGYSF